MSDSEVLCLGVAAQWRSGVPWRSERGIIRYVRKHLRHLFPTVLTQSAFNRRLRRLWGAFILIQNAVAEALPAAGDYDIMDGFPIPVTHGARSFTPGWLADIARIGKGGNDRYCYGVRMMMVINQQGGPRAGPSPQATSKNAGWLSDSSAPVLGAPAYKGRLMRTPTSPRCYRPRNGWPCCPVVVRCHTSLS
jgi:hypothetical protein